MNKVFIMYGIQVFDAPLGMVVVAPNESTAKQFHPSMCDDDDDYYRYMEAKLIDGKWYCKLEWDDEWEEDYNWTGDPEIEEVGFTESVPRIVHVFYGAG